MGFSDLLLLHFELIGEILPIFNNISCYHSISRINLYRFIIGLVVIIGEIICIFSKRSSS